MKKCIHIFGASGAGTSTLGQAISNKYGHKWLDTDNYFWCPTDPPFTVKRECNERIRLLLSDIEKNDTCVISGSLCDWGDVFIPKFDLCIWIKTPTAVRIERLKNREYARFGKRILPGGDMYVDHTNFIEWAKTYDTANSNQRSFAMHNEWKDKLTCPLLVLDGTESVETLMQETERIINETTEDYGL